MKFSFYGDKILKKRIGNQALPDLTSKEVTVSRSTFNYKLKNKSKNKCRINERINKC